MLLVSQDFISIWHPTEVPPYQPGAALHLGAARTSSFIKLIRCRFISQMLLHPHAARRHVSHTFRVGFQHQHGVTTTTIFYGRVTSGHGQECELDG